MASDSGRDAKRIRLDEDGEHASGASTPHHPEQMPPGLITTEAEERHKWFVGSIDQGTTSSRFIIFNGEGDPVASHQIEFENHYPEPG